MVEKNLQSLFSSWVPNNWGKTTAWELKLEKGRSIRFDRFSPHQVDCFYISRAEAYVVVVFYVPRQPKDMLFIDIDTWVERAKNSIRKSLTNIEAREIASFIYTLK